MSDNLIYCTKCGKETHFIRADKYVRIYELPNDEMETIHVIQCEVCGTPITAYPDLITIDEN